MNARGKRRRVESSVFEPASNYYGDGPLCPATDSDKKSWSGFCEIESEPALFNVMLRDFGVKGVKVQEVVSLDKEMMNCLHKPVYGLIFLFRWREDDPKKQEVTCPEGLWFANQTASNACASVALLNIVNNVDGIDLGDHLQQFKEFTMSFTPALRGDAINNFEFVKKIHNSFARKMDMLNSDLHLKNESKFKRRSSTENDYENSEAEAAFHFIAFVPALGRVWKFDGLERQPQALGDCSHGDWLDLARPDILTRMAEYEEGQIEFSILGLVRDPLLDYTKKLALNVKLLEMINRRMTANGQEIDVSDLEDTLVGPDPSYDLSREAIDQVEISEEEQKRYLECSEDSLLLRRQELSNLQHELRVGIREEQQTRRSDEEYAAGRRFDYSPAIRTWIRFLARKNAIKKLASIV